MAATSTSPASLIKLPTVVARTTLSKPYIYALIKSGHFPAPIRVGRRASAWVESEVQRWIADRIRATRQSAPQP